MNKDKAPGTRFRLAHSTQRHYPEARRLEAL